MKGGIIWQTNNSSYLKAQLPRILATKFCHNLKCYSLLQKNKYFKIVWANGSIVKTALGFKTKGFSTMTSKQPLVRLMYMGRLQNHLHQGLSLFLWYRHIESITGILLVVGRVLYM